MRFSKDKTRISKIWFWSEKIWERKREVGIIWILNRKQLFSLWFLLQIRRFKFVWMQRTILNGSHCWSETIKSIWSSTRQYCFDCSRGFQKTMALLIRHKQFYFRHDFTDQEVFIRFCDKTKFNAICKTFSLYGQLLTTDSNGEIIIAWWYTQLFLKSFPKCTNTPLKNHLWIVKKKVGNSLVKPTCT
jgi:hypothetical protein